MDGDPFVSDFRHDLFTGRTATVSLYGEAYSDSAIYLALLSLGYYFNVALGFNGLTLNVVGRLRYIVTLNILAAVTNVGLNLILIPRYGALGAAIGTTVTLVVHNVLKQAGLRLATGINIFEWSMFRVYVIIGGAIAGWWSSPPSSTSASSPRSG